MDNIFEEIKEERARQDRKFGANRTQGPFLWNTILTEEVGEVAEASLDLVFGGFSKQNYQHLREELVQVAAVAVAYIEDMERQNYAD